MLKPARLADYTIVFARGRMVLAYAANDPKANALPVTGTFNPPSSVPHVTGKWYETLTAPGVRISGAHPFMDPGGYRAHMILELAQAHYKVPALYNTLLQHYQVNVADPSSPAPALGKDFNFQFTYEHNAARAARRDAQYRYAALPPEIDLSSAATQYAASITIPGLGMPGSSPSVIIRASATEWGVAIPTDARNRDLAAAFVASLLGPVGRTALTTEGPPPVAAPRVSRNDVQKLPTVLRPLTVAN
jgi:molybdate/tungstate transport system substrate-binding protein